MTTYIVNQPNFSIKTPNVDNNSRNFLLTTSKNGGITEALPTVNQDLIKNTPQSV